MSATPPKIPGTKRSGKWLPVTRRGRIILLTVLVFGTAATVTGLQYEKEIKTAWRRWWNKMPDSVRDRLHGAKTVTLYSLYPEKVDGTRQYEPSFIDDMSWAQLQVLPKFQGYSVLGQFTSMDESLIRQVAGELHAGTRHPDPPGFLCFYPRHGLRVQDADGTLDLLICLGCSRIEIFENDDRSGSHHRFEQAKDRAMSKGLQAAFFAQNMPMALTEPKPQKTGSPAQ
ncbi:MAG TPA: hypothetical protein VG796_24415 [Verrucomicrobiales bacterium]|jgi:hypothetical protein|nr:hypothetical protein [Verrucomicrobiales bacterium]